ncbi:helix-turn-helix domain-containing protein [Tepidiforma sp.]|uniref:helix-turn-helix domain-containing protein n=1 Tax=Tepidiforma sp. TaxID=2682230 RepID=UPI002ADE0C93|nr:helix-turn-helix domain-containing protein [Tepidiforma sp.]
MGELGSLLTRAREARGLTLEDAERDTRISRRYLAALEAEQFHIIPAPVYARGFLRSYSQYLGLDPQEMLAMFPREDEDPYGRGAEPERPSLDRPVSPVSASRPAWRSAPRQEPTRGAPRPAPRAPDEEPVIGRGPVPPWRAAAAEREPVIGVDIGVPAPARRIATDPAAQTRSAFIAIVAIVAILGVVFVAYLLASLAGGDGSAPPGSLGETPTATAAAGATPTGPSGLPVTPGIVPDLRGVPEGRAVAAIREAGYEPLVARVKSNQPAGTVIDQSPAPDVEMAPGSKVQIVVSEGP